MFARPYESAAASSGGASMLTPRRQQSKHQQLFRNVHPTAIVSHSVLRHSYSATRPQSAASGDRPISAIPFDPASPSSTRSEPSYSPQLTRPSTAQGTGEWSQHATPSGSQSARPSSAVNSSPRSGDQMLSEKQYQAAYLTAVAARHAVESDRLTLFNRLQLLKAQEEKARKQVEYAWAQAAKAEAVRERHAREAQERLVVNTEREEARYAAAQRLRQAHADRKANLQEWQQNKKLIRREAAYRAREEHRMLLDHRRAMTEEELSKWRLVRADLTHRHDVYLARKESQKQAEKQAALLRKQQKIAVEQHKKWQAEQDLVRMEAEEAELIQRSIATQKLQEEALARLSAVVMHENKLPTARSRYVSISAQQGRKSPRKLQFSVTTSEDEQSAIAEPLQQFSLSAPSAQAKATILQSHHQFAPQPPSSHAPSNVLTSPRHHAQSSQQQQQQHNFQVHISKKPSLGNESDAASTPTSTTTTTTRSHHRRPSVHTGSAREEEKENTSDEIQMLTPEAEANEQQRPLEVPEEHAEESSPTGSQIDASSSNEPAADSLSPE